MNAPPLLIEVKPSLPVQLINGCDALNEYVIFSWYEPERRWKLRPETFLTPTDAEKFCDILPRGHIYAAIFHVMTNPLTSNQT